MENGLFCGECQKPLDEMEEEVICDIAMRRFLMRKISDGQEVLCVECAENLGIMDEFFVKGAQDAGKGKVS